jgi:hypothetical protein
MSTFDSDTLPPLTANSGGFAFPKPSAPVITCLMPADEMLSSYGGKQMLKGIGGLHYHVVFGLGDQAPNDKFLSDYNITGEANIDDPMAVYLVGFWAERGHQVKPLIGAKTQPVVIIGILAEDCDFKSHEGVAPFNKGDVLVKSVKDNRAWIIKAAKFNDRYQPYWTWATIKEWLKA